MFENIEEQGVQDQGALFETFFIDAVQHMDEESAKEFLQSEAVNALVEAGGIRKGTLVRLSKEDDYNRRIALAAMQKAKESNSPDWKKLKKAAAMKKLAISNIIKRYGNAVKRDVIKAQKALLKADPMHYVRLPKAIAPKADKD